MRVRVGVCFVANAPIAFLTQPPFVACQRDSIVKNARTYQQLFSKAEIENSVVVTLLGTPRGFTFLPEEHFLRF